MKRQLETACECRRHCHPQGFKPGYLCFQMSSSLTIRFAFCRLMIRQAEPVPPRVLIEFADSDGGSWRTVGVSTNIIDASVIALADGMCWKLLHAGETA